GGLNITYKILYNDAVAMTGGQPIDGPLSPRMVVDQVLAEGVKRVVVVSDDPEQFAAAPFPPGVAVRPRDELEAVQRELREESGVTVLLYVQTCAAEKRRRRKRGAYPDLPKRAFINELVCEGCGDCGVKSNCVSVLPLETEFGRKRLIDQSSCNKDYSCVKGFCPSFVTVEGGKLRKPSGAGAVAFPALPEPAHPSTQRPFNIMITGIGGTGVVTIGALLGMAAHLQGKGVSVLDMTGLAQKNGAVLCHVRIADRPEDIHATRIAAGDADAVIACDVLVAVSDEALAKMQLGITRAAVNASAVMPASFTGLADLQFPVDAMEREIIDAVGRENVAFVDATRLATSLLGDSIATNPFMLGYAYQKGMVPLSEEALMRAIELNGAAIDMNKKSFHWGRWAAAEIAKVESFARPREAPADSQRLSTSLEEVISRRVAYLTDYQNAAYARRYSALVERVRGAERAVARGTALSDAVARHYFKLLAIKDEYEVARLFTDGEFERRVAAVFEGDYQLHFHLAPPFWVKPDPLTGEIKKREYGPWMKSAFKLLARMKGLRGTALDLFGRSAERKLERRLLAEYEATIEHLLQRVTADNLPLAVEIAALPEQIRGYGHVKDFHVRAAKQREQELLARFDAPAVKATTLAGSEE
ncbi:MAG: indolepyruvate ferredoxin oxidoreductase family protein, partial [Burkholderiales bacterium]